MKSKNSTLQSLDVHVDALVMLFCTQIASDIQTFVKRHVKPRVKDAADLSMTDMQILLAVSRHARRITPTEISEVLRYDRSSITRSVKKLQKKGLVYIEDDHRDLRSINVICSDDGKAICDEYHAWFVAAFQEMDEIYNIGFSDDERNEILANLRVLARRTYLLSTERRPLRLKPLEEPNKNTDAAE